MRLRSRLAFIVWRMGLEKSEPEAATLPTAGNADASAKVHLVISGGRVMDPESGLDAVRNVGFAMGKLRRFRILPYRAKLSLMPRGLLSRRGSSICMSTGQEPRNYQFQAHDGVTTRSNSKSGPTMSRSGTRRGRKGADQLWREHRAHSCADER